MTQILVIGATGTVGRQVVSQLVAKGVRVRALVRNPAAARLPAEVEVLPGDLTIPETLDSCLAGVETVFLVWTAPPGAVEAALQRITTRSKRVVLLSAPLKTQHPLFQQANLLRTMFEQIELLIVSSGVRWTILRPGMFAANALNWWAPQIRAGHRVSGSVLSEPEPNVVRWPYLDLPTAPIDERDIAAVAVRALTEDCHDRAEYVLTGPESLTHREQIATIGRAIGRTLRIEELSPEEALRDGLPSVPPPAVNMLLNAWSAAAGHPAYLSSTYSQVTGTAAHTFQQWAADHAAEFRA